MTTSVAGVPRLKGNDVTLTDAFQRPDGGASAWRLQAGDPSWDRSSADRRQPGVAAGGRPDGEIETAVPAGSQLADSLRRAMTAVRSSVPLRTVAFLLPPLVLPFALGLSLGATLAVGLLLLWLAAAAAVLTTMMFDGSDQLALRAIERRLERLAGGSLSSGGASSDAHTDTEALMAIGVQLDAMGDRLDELAAMAIRTPKSPDMTHRPQEHWSSAREGDQNDRYDHGVEPERHWSQPRWQP